MSRIGQAIRRFMIGRYGTDSLNNLLLWVYFVSVLFNMFIGFAALNILSIICIVIVFARMFSRNIYQRQKENMQFIALKTKLKRKFNLLKDRWKFRKTHIYRKCPNCKVTLRLPKIKGKHTCCCPKCKKSFKVYC